MARTPRSSLPDGYFHVSARGVDRSLPLFADTVDRTTFLHLLRRTIRGYGWSCHALCLMSTHYHLVVESTQKQLSAGLQWLNCLYALHFNQRHGRFGHVFAGRFDARAIEDEEYLYAACAYVVLNPVQAGLCESADGWPWSYSRYGFG
jgi:putative transposase